MWAQYSLYTLPPKNGRLRKREDLPKERGLLDCMIHKAASEATAGKKVYLLAMGISESPLVRRITMLHPDLSSFLKAVHGNLVACTPPIQPRMFSPVPWFRAVPEAGATVVIYGADMIFNSYAAAVKALKEAQKEKNCEIIFAWRDADAPTMPPPVTFDAWDELNVLPDKPVPAHTPFKISKEDYYNNPKWMKDPLLLYCPAKELAYRLDPDDPRDRRLLDAFDSEKRRR